MSHSRTQIREQVAALLGAVVGEQRVYIQPHETIADDQLPAYVITTPDEQLSPDTYLNGRVRILTVQVECLGVGANELDDMSASVESALPDSSLGDLVTDWAWQSTQISFMRDQARQVGSARLAFTCRYLTSTTDPSVII